MEANQKIILIHEIRPRPEQAPEGWEVWNAPRPMAGTRHFQGEFIHGIFYGVIDPTDAYADNWRRLNIRDDGTMLEWISLEEAKTQVVALYTQRYPKMAAEGKVDRWIQTAISQEVAKTHWQLVNTQESR